MNKLNRTLSLEERLAFADMQRQGISSERLLQALFMQKLQEQQEEEMQVKEALSGRLKALKDFQSNLLQFSQLDSLAPEKAQIEELERMAAESKNAAIKLEQILKVFQENLLKEKESQAELKDHLHQLQSIKNERPSLPYETPLYEIGQAICSDLASTNKK